ncbi:MAG: hypothetical protein GDA36_06055 [Rhodobacteraceae bacterium]|nr:hypothetical protein [Paracoccaceae bacterium]
MTAGSLSIWCDPEMGWLSGEHGQTTPVQCRRDPDMPDAERPVWPAVLGPSIDSTGIKVEDEGGLKAHKHHRIWRKIQDRD